MWRLRYSGMVLAFGQRFEVSTAAVGGNPGTVSADAWRPKLAIPNQGAAGRRGAERRDEGRKGEAEGRGEPGSPGFPCFAGLKSAARVLPTARWDRGRGDKVLESHV